MAQEIARIDGGGQPLPQVQQRSETAEVLAIISAAAKDPSVDPAKMSALVSLKERLDARQAEIEYSQALAQMQPILPRIRKNGTIDLGNNRKPIPFAKWEDIDTVIRPILNQFGFSLSFPTRIEGGQLVMACVLSHVAGHSERSEAPVMPDSGPWRNSTQAVGSGRSYTKRYLATDMLNLVFEGQDDDGRGAGFVNEEQARELEDMIQECRMSDARKSQFFKFMDATGVRSIQSNRFEEAKLALRKELAKVRAGR